MKIVKVSVLEHLCTPWLSTDEAAEYCGVSRETFRKIQRETLPCPATGGNSTNRRYHATVLDEWWKTVCQKTNR